MRTDIYKISFIFKSSKKVNADHVKGYIGLTATKNWIESINKTKYAFNYQCSVGGIYYNNECMSKGPVMVHNQPYDIVHNKIEGTLTVY